MGRPFSVLIVDDHEDIRRMLPRLLRAVEVEVSGEAASGEEALAWLEENSADIVVMDIQMPGIGGIQATKQIKELYPSVVVFGFTGFGDEDMTEMLAAGATAVFQKTKLIDLLESIRGLPSD
jgi:two-component system invasion response regulator UvrY